MTDEQWLWIYANWILDNDEKLESMCQKCKDSAMDNTKCSHCGTTIRDDNRFVNPNFDIDKFNELNN